MELSGEPPDPLTRRLDGPSPGREKKSLAAARKINNTGARHGPRNG